MIFFDGQCPFCRREISFMQSRDSDSKLRFVDIASSDFHASHYGLEHQELQSVIHAITPDGEVLTRMDVFRAAYEEIGLGWILRITKWPIFEALFDWTYSLFAKYRDKLGSYLCCSQCRAGPGKQ